MFPPVFEVVVNQSSEGGFNLSQDAIKWMSMNGYEEVKDIIKAGDDLVFACSFSECERRHDPWLVKAVKALGPMASAGKSNLKVTTVTGKSYSVVSNGHLEVAVSGLHHPQLDFIEVPADLLRD